MVAATGKQRPADAEPDRGVVLFSFLKNYLECTILIPTGGTLVTIHFNENLVNFIRTFDIL